MKTCASMLAVVSILGAAPPPQKGNLRAGAARIDITPAKDDALPMSGYAARQEGHKGIHDNLYVRAIALDDGAGRAAIVTADLIGFSHQFTNAVSERITSEANIALDHILIAGTHTHSRPPREPTAGTSIRSRNTASISGACRTPWSRPSNRRSNRCSRPESALRTAGQT